MLSLKEIEQYYPTQLRPFRRNILREYLQYTILEIIFDSPLATKLSFLGGTALCIVHNNPRFSEDLDFDNFGMSEQDFTLLATTIQQQLEKQGYEVEMNTVFKGAYRCNIKLPKILFLNELSPYENEKILIQIDTAPHSFAYTPNQKVLNKFGILTNIFVTPIDIILSQKIFAALERKRAKGRDFFDIVFLLSLTKPNYEYLVEKVNIHTPEELRQRLLAYTEQLDMAALSRDVEPFLFSSKESKRVLLFTEYIQQVPL